MLSGIIANLSPKSKNWGKAMDVLIRLLDADKSKDEKAQLKAQTQLVKAKAAMLSGNDSSVLEKLDDVLKQIGE